MKTFAQILSGLNADADRKIDAKIPSWKGLAVPSSLNLEQCSSELAAAYKASLLCRPGAVGATVQSGSASGWIGCGRSVADLTGGLGVDSAAFSRVADSVFYVERDPVLAQAAASNFKALGIENITVKCAQTDAGLVKGLPHCDCIFLDPARRSASGRKVFLLEDCSPDVTALLPLLLEKASLVMLKLSPMADITMLRRRLGPALREIHIVGLQGECKELLCLLSSDGSGFKLVVVDAAFPDRALEIPESAYGCSVASSADRGGLPCFAAEVPRPGTVLCVPTAISVKAANQAFFCDRFSMKPLSRESGICILASAAALPDPLFYKSWEIITVEDFGREGFRKVGQLYPRCDVTARGVRMTSDELASRLKVSPGGDIHVFATLCGLPTEPDKSGQRQKSVLFVTRRI